MKSNPFLRAISIITFFTSCSKSLPENINKKEPQSQENIETASTKEKTKLQSTGTNGANMKLPSSTVVPITLSKTSPFVGQYISSYGMGITFGTNLPHPITPDPLGIHDGEPIPTITYVSWTLNPQYPVTSTIQGAFFDILEPTFPSTDNTRQQIKNYQTSLTSYFKDTTGTVPYPPPLGTISGSTNGFIEVRGMVIRDHTSPTLMSACSDKFKPAPAPLD